MTEEYMPSDADAEKFIEQMRPVLRELSRKIPRLDNRELEACATALVKAGKIGWNLAMESKDGD